MDFLTMFFTGWAVVLAAAYVFTKIFPNFRRDLHPFGCFLRLRREMKNESISFLDRFYQIVLTNGEKKAIVNAVDGESLTFQQLEELSNQVANWAISIGLKEGETVALLGPNSADFVVWWMGLVKAGLQVAFLNFNLRGKSLVHCIKVCKAVAFVVLADRDGKLDLLRSAEEVYPDCEDSGSLQFYTVDGEAAGASRIDEDVKKMPQEGLSERRAISREPNPMLFVYTSGTTGLPKAAVIRHSKFKGYAGCFREYYSMKGSETLYCCLPLYHSAGGLLGVGTMLSTGVTLVIRPKFSARVFWSDIQKYKCTTFQYVGEICRFLLAQPESDLDSQHGAKRGIGNGLRPDVWEKFTSRFKVQCQEFYGATEGNVPFFNWMGKPNAVGHFPWLGRRAKDILFIRYNRDTDEPVRDEKTGLCFEVDDNEVGLLVGRISERMPFAGYSNEKETDKKILQDVRKKGDRWMNSGDLLSIDADGFVYFHDRAGDTFRWKSENVSTTEVAEIMTTFPEIAECNVYGVKVPHTDGRAGMAAIKLKDGVGKLSAKALFASLEKQLPAYAQPVFLRLQESLVTTTTYKYSKVQLVKDGFSPNEIAEPLYYRNAKESTYSRLDKDVFKKIANQELRL